MAGNFNSATNEYFFKVVLIGAPSVGKTSILERFVSNAFSDDYKATIGADFRTKDIEINGQTVLLQIWDTAGQERFRALAAPFYRGANICVLVFDVSDQMTFEVIDTWREEFLHHADVENQEQFPFLLLGNKSDLGAKVIKSEVNRWVQQREYRNMVYLETSALNNTNITEAFYEVGRLCLSMCQTENIYEPQKEVDEDLNENENTNENENGNVDLEEAMSVAPSEITGSSMCGSFCLLL